MIDQNVPESYWEERQGALYYKVVKLLVEGLGKNARSILDVGSAGCPYLEWFGFIPDRASTDLHKPYVAPGIRNFTGDFLEWEPDKKYDIVTCLQVLEHVPDAKAFAQKLLASGDVVIVSVPYKWRAGQTPTHVHDPVDEAKMLDWFGREPSYQYVCLEVQAKIERLIQVYEANGVHWKSLNHRARKIAQMETTQAVAAKPKRLFSRFKKWVKKYLN